MSESRVKAAAPDRAEFEAAFASLGLIGRSPAFQAVLALLPIFAACDAPVLLRGETGTGKELFARALHYMSPRHDRPFVPVNCGGLPDALLESELFGHVKGAFTDARLDRPGLVAMADRGTLFLDEIDSLSRKGQVALLRFLQDHEYRQVGGQKARTADVRVLSATNADLVAQVARGRFRQDLLFRLDVLTLELPRLAARPDDVPLLTRHFLVRFAAQYERPVPTLDAAALTWLGAQAWPGNVRELENVMHRALLLAENGRVVLPPPGAEVPEPPAGTALYGGGLRATCARTRWETEERYLRELIALTGGNVSEAARRAGTERRAMGRLLKRHGIGAEAFKHGAA
jgi:DNA-binding NtrC family response regulator